MVRDPKDRGGSPGPAHPVLIRREDMVEADRPTIQPEGAWEESTTIAETPDLENLVEQLGNFAADLSSSEHTIDDPREAVAFPNIPVFADAVVVPARAALRVLSGPDEGRTFELPSARAMTMGRATNNDIVLADIAVSRVHVKLRFDGATWRLDDQGSGNGTLVNDLLEDDEVAIRHGDRIELGNTLLQLEHPGTMASAFTSDFEAEGTNALTREGRAFRDGDAEMVLPTMPPGSVDIQLPVSERVTYPQPVQRRPSSQPRQTSQPHVVQRRPTIPPAELRERASQATVVPTSGRRAARTVPPPFRAQGAPRRAATQPPPPPQPTFQLPPMASMEPPKYAAPLAPTYVDPLAGFGPEPSAAYSMIPPPLPPPHFQPVGGNRGQPTSPVTSYPRPPAEGGKPSRRWLPWVIGGSAIFVGTVAVVAALGGDGSGKGKFGAGFAIGNNDENVMTAPDAAIGQPLVDAGPVVIAAVIDAAPAPKIDAASALAVVDAAPAPDAAVKIVRAADATAAAEAKAKAEAEAKAKAKAAAEAKAKAKAAAEAKAKAGPVDVSAALAKAEKRYQTGDFSGAASILRSAASGASGSAKKDLATQAADYDAIARGVAASRAGTPTSSLAALKKAVAADARSGRNHASELKSLIGAVAPKAALAHLAKGDLEAAYSATVDAASAGAGGNSNVKMVRSSLEKKASDLYTSGVAKLKTDPPAGKADLRRIYKLVPKSSSWYSKATTALAKD